MKVVCATLIQLPCAGSLCYRLQLCDLRLFFPQDPCLIAQEGPILEMDQGCVVKKAVVPRIRALFVTEDTRCVVNEAGNYRKRKGGLVVKAAECCPGKLDSSPASATELLCDVGQVS